MSMGNVSKDEFEVELEKLGLVIPEKKIEQFETEIKDIERGRGPTKEVPEEIREFIASEAISGATHKQLAEEFGVSPSSVSAYKHGNTSTASYNKPDTSLAKANSDVRDRIIGKAQRKLTDSLDAIDIVGSKLSAKVAADIAMKMSAVCKNLSPHPDSINVNQTKVVLF